MVPYEINGKIKNWRRFSSLVRIALKRKEKLYTLELEWGWKASLITFAMKDELCGGKRETPGYGYYPSLQTLVVK